MLTLTLISSVLFLNSSSECSKNELKSLIYSIFATSLLAGVALTGIFSVLIAVMNISWMPIWLIVLVACIAWLSTKKHKIKTKLIVSIICHEFSKAKAIGNRHKYLSIIIALITFLASISSIGPINHPDAADYHVGYALQMYVQNSLIVDGGLHQGLLGLNDYAHFAFIQENLVWTIRSCQILTLFPLVLYLVNKKTSLILVLAFVSAPVFIQWATIGKPLFLAESSLAIAYLSWNSIRSIKSVILLITCCILSVLFKTSSLIVIFPIVVQLYCFYYGRSIKLKTITSNEIVLLCICFIGIAMSLCLKYSQTLNPIYPLLSKHITPLNLMQISFEESLKQYNGVGNPFPLSLFIPTSMSYISSNLGIGVSLALIFPLLAKYHSRKDLMQLIVGVTQFLLIFLIGQKRGDYYSAPIIIMFCGTAIQPAHSMFICSLRNLLLLVLKLVALPIQIVITIATLFGSITLTVLAILDYENTMNQTAYGYQITKDIEKYSNGKRYLKYFGRNTRYYSQSGSYIDRDAFDFCTGSKPTNHKLLGCMKRLDIQVMAISPEYKQRLEKYLTKCKLSVFPKASRNPFNSSTKSSYICELKIEPLKAIK